MHCFYTLPSFLFWVFSHFPHRPSHWVMFLGLWYTSFIPPTAYVGLCGAVLLWLVEVPMRVFCSYCAYDRRYRVCCSLQFPQKSVRRNLEVYTKEKCLVHCDSRLKLWNQSSGVIAYVKKLRSPPPPISERPSPIDFNGVKHDLGKMVHACPKYNTIGENGWISGHLIARYLGSLYDTGTLQVPLTCSRTIRIMIKVSPTESFYCLIVKFPWSACLDAPRAGPAI